MADPELGTKQVCPECEAKFYDLNKRPATCPKCGHSFDPADETVQAARTKVRTKAAQEAVPEDDDEDDDEEEEALAAKNTLDDEDDDAGEEEARELGADEDEVPIDMSSTGDGDDEAAPGKVPAGFSEEGVDDDQDDELLDDDEDEFDLGDDDIDIDDDNELGDPDADDIDPDEEDDN